ncbi:MAG: hypothetical protein [Bacteriophage sp.]|jgi:hypothetical protein|nr:MAG: hypothetical protein [Bacteriophage sp.]DAL47778.1 MAG TPA_asm: hypothetical protein [Caudoviricetes sp.]DAL55567.1 MAG TPA_asm: hypothetical protein [Caudoviricetes sp.]
MLNREKYAKEILDVVCSGHCFAKVDGKITECGRTDCDECDFGDSFICMAKAMEWANSEYVEPPVDWSKVAVDTPILVKDVKSGEWNRGYFAMYENGTVFTWYHGATSWSAEGESDIASWKFAKLAESEE